MITIDMTVEEFDRMMVSMQNTVDSREHAVRVAEAAGDEQSAEIAREAAARYDEIIVKFCLQARRGAQKSTVPDAARLERHNFCYWHRLRL